MPELFNSWVHPLTAFLYTKVLITRWCFLDLWSFVHLGSGGLVMVWIQHLRMRRPFGVLLLSLFGYEAVEIVLTALVGLFKPEILPDQVTDIVVGMVGGVFAWIAGCHAVRGRTAVPLRTDAAAATALALLWVSVYGYRYNISALNSPGVNWLGLLLWTSGLLIVFRLYNTIRPSFSHPTLAVTIVWAFFLCLLFGIEYIGYYELGIHELHAGTPMAFGLIHGTPLLKIVYATAPPVALGGRALVLEALAVTSSPRSPGEAVA